LNFITSLTCSFLKDSIANHIAELKITRSLILETERFLGGTEHQVKVSVFGVNQSQ